MRFSKERFKKNAPKDIQRKLANHLDALDDTEVIFNGQYGCISQYFLNGQEYYLYPVYKSWCAEEGGEMKHYCRYCSHCIAQDEEDAVCEENNEMIKRTSVRKGCQHFDFCEIDAFYFDKSDNPEDAKYRPRKSKKKQCDGQISLF